MRFRPFAVALAFLAVGPHAQHRGFRSDDSAERSFFELRGSAPPDARRLALEQIRRTRNLAPDHLWKSLGPAPLHSGNGLTDNGRVTGILLSPLDPNLVVAGTSSGGIWRSTDRGAHFVPVSDDQIDLNVGAMAIAPSNPNVMYAGMGDDHVGTGVLKSTDAGATWHRVTDAQFPARSATNRIVVDPHDENVVWLAQSRTLDANLNVSSSLALLHSLDGGVTWTRAFNGVVDDVLIVSDDGKTLLAGAARAARPGTGGIYRTTDSGATWTLVYPQGQMDVPPTYFLAKAGASVYAVAVDALDDIDRRQLIVSTDGGEQWTKRADAPDDIRMLYLAANPHDGTLYLGAVGGYRSSDGGMTWASMRTHVDHHAIAFDPVSPSTIWLGNDGGLKRSVDAGVTIESFADRIPAMQLYTVNAHPSDPNILVAGSQDNGLQVQDHGLEWTAVLSGDYGSTVFEPGTGRILANSLSWNILRFPQNGRGTAELVTSAKTFGDPNRISFIAPMVRGADGTVWFGTYRLFASRDFGTTWTPPAGDLDLTFGSETGGRGDLLTQVAVSDTDPRVLFTGSAVGRVMLTHDAGVTWTEITPPVRSAIGGLAISRTASATAYLGFGGYGMTRVMKTTDFGASWTDMSAGLPRMPIDALYTDPRHVGRVYAGTDVGVFLLDAASQTWVPLDNGMPHVIVTSFTTTADGRLIAGTYGRGVYELELSESKQSTVPRRRAVRP